MTNAVLEPAEDFISVVHRRRKIRGSYQSGKTVEAIIYAHVTTLEHITMEALEGLLTSYF